MMLQSPQPRVVTVFLYLNNGVATGYLRLHWSGAINVRPEDDLNGRAMGWRFGIHISCRHNPTKQLNKCHSDHFAQN